MELLASNRYLWAFIFAIVVFIVYMKVNSLFDRKHKDKQLSDIEDYTETQQLSSGDELVSMDIPVSTFAKSLQGIMKAAGINVKEGLDHWGKLCVHAGVNSVDAPTYVLFYRRIIGPFIAVIGAILLFKIISAGGKPDFLKAIIAMVLVIIGMLGLTNLLAPNAKNANIY